MSHAPIRLAVLGDPLTFTLSPQLHRAGLDALGVPVVSEAIRTPIDELAARLRALANRGYRGVNLTMPLKEAALSCLSRASDAARRARSVNTVGFEPGETWGDTTDGDGFLDLLVSLGRDPARERAVLLGAGGAARSVALALLDRGSNDVVALAREPGRAEAAWRDVKATLHRWDSPEARASMAAATLVVNATPLDDAEGRELPLVELSRGALLIDLRYGREPTSWVRRARSAGREAYDGLGLLVFQARRALGLWMGQEPPVQPMAAAVGWPR